ncbi:MAG: GTPase Era [Spirochaetaceae bacterium]|nr:MAG: GTPase Era [Spirochaetaceae bacterium]
MKSAFVAIAGRPSAGKSTLLNKLCGHKVSIVSPVPQTTRNKIRGIVTKEKGQLVFLDTPGYYASEKKFNTYMHDVLSAAIGEADLVLYMIDLSRPPGEEEGLLAGLVKKSGKPAVVAFNKTDISPNHREAVLALLKSRELSAPIVPICALDGKNIESLSDLLFEKAPDGELMYPAEFYTDQDPEFRISEIVREKAFLHTRQELPHALYVEIEDMEMHEDQNTLWVRGFLCVERESQKGILIGHRGQVIKAIVQEALAELAPLFPYRVELDFRVKVRPKWKGNDHLLGRLIR